jgi:hypothetical protein
LEAKKDDGSVIIPCIKISFILSVRVVLIIAGKVLVLGAVADFGTQNYQYTTKVDAS